MVRQNPREMMEERRRRAARSRSDNIPPSGSRGDNIPPSGSRGDIIPPSGSRGDVPFKYSSRPPIRHLTVRSDILAETKTYSVSYGTGALGILNKADELVFKNEVDSTVYSTKVESLGIFSGTRRRMYRGPPEMDICIASIEAPDVITFTSLAGEECLEIGKTGWLKGRSTFSIEGINFSWLGFSKLVDDTGVEWMTVSYPLFRWRKICDLTVTYTSDEMRDVFIAAFIARHWEEQLEQEEAADRRRRSNNAYDDSRRMRNNNQS